MSTRSIKKDNLLNEIYNQFGFNLNIENFDLDYDIILSSIDLGPYFEEIIKEHLWLDSEKIGKYIKKYVLHLLLQEAMNFSFEEKHELLNFKETTILGQPIESILCEIFYRDPTEWAKTLGLLDKKYNNDSELTDVIANELHIERNKIDSKRWHVKAIKSGSLYPLYAKYYLKSSRIPMIKHYDKIIDFPSEIEGKIHHLKEFYGFIEKNHINPSQDLLEHETNSYSLFLLKASAIKDTNCLETGNKEPFLDSEKTIAYFTLFPDIRSKLYLVESVLSEDFDSPFTNEFKFFELFKISYLFIPLLTEFLKKQLSFYCETQVADTKGLNKDLKSRLFIYQLLKTKPCYTSEIIDEFNIPDRIEISEEFKNVWKYTDKTKRKLIDKYTIDSYLANMSSELLEKSNMSLIKYLEFCAFIEFQKLGLLKPETKPSLVDNSYSDYKFDESNECSSELDNIQNLLEVETDQKLQLIEFILMENNVDINKISPSLKKAGISSDFFAKHIWHWL